MVSTSPDPKVIVALDFDDANAANELISKLDPRACRLKIGKEMFTYFGPDWVKSVVALGFDVFLDLKFHDIPNTVARAVKAAASLGVWMVNVHASGGPEMMKAAIQALKETGEDRPLLTAVTVLTSMDQSQLDSVVGNSPRVWFRWGCLFCARSDRIKAIS
jgi:orotidine-5'-phosphate decarboxylase